MFVTKRWNIATDPRIYLGRTMIIDPVMTHSYLEEEKKSQTVMIDRKVLNDYPILQDALDASVIVAQNMPRL